MRRRIHFFGGLLALVAMVFSFAGSVAASTCAPMSDILAGMIDDGGAADGVECPFMAHPDSDGANESQSCPFDQAPGQSCSVAAALPTQSSGGIDPPAGLTSGNSTLEVEPHLLLAYALFHPPRA